MAAFTISYRLPSGGLKSEVIDAADRASALAQMKARGITPVSVKTGGRVASVSSSAAKPAWIKGAIAGVLVIVLGIVIVLMLLPEKRPVLKPAPVAQKQKVDAPKPAPCVKPVPVEKLDAKKAPEKTVDNRRAELRRKLKAMPKEDRQELSLQILKEKPLDLTPTTNRPFKTATELHLARIFMTEIGDLPPPPIPKVPIHDEVHLEEILLADNPIIEGDDAKIQEAKQMVELAKKELRQYIKDGGDADSFIQYYYSKLTSAYQERRDSLREVMRVAKEDPGIAGEYYRQVNKKLRDKGIKALAVPDKVKQKFGLED